MCSNRLSISDANQTFLKRSKVRSPRSTTSSSWLGVAASQLIETANSSCHSHTRRLKHRFRPAGAAR
ncbi:uncharacterized protein Dana_GF27029 [Drosophila ananassae]|uniref:Uncharacterized protein n=1 Tax=Drosophila ananassae TaxID=7217 RepID=A0A0P9A1A0_DROAN|nr:uncharacterized protein Dana_GF27029 [Drosophila ananassae]